MPKQNIYVQSQREITKNFEIVHFVQRLVMSRAIKFRSCQQKALFTNVTSELTPLLRSVLINKFVVENHFAITKRHYQQKS